MHLNNSTVEKKNNLYQPFLWKNIKQRDTYEKKKKI